MSTPASFDEVLSPFPPRDPVSAFAFFRDASSSRAANLLVASWDKVRAAHSPRPSSCRTGVSATKDRAACASCRPLSTLPPCSTCAGSTSRLPQAHASIGASDCTSTPHLPQTQSRDRAGRDHRQARERRMPHTLRRPHTAAHFWVLGRLAQALEPLRGAGPGTSAHHFAAAQGVCHGHRPDLYRRANRRGQGPDAAPCRRYG